MSEQNELRRLAKAATRGKWKALIYGDVCAVELASDRPIVAWSGFDAAHGSKKKKEANARFIAAANPAAVIKLLDRIELLERGAADERKTDEQIRELALVNGFKLKEQPDGTMSLNPYVYDFARELMDSATIPDATTGEQIRDAALEEAARIVEAYKVSAGNSAAGEMAADWTMTSLREIRDAIRALIGKEPT